MAVFVKPIPTLRGEVAERFNSQAQQNELHRGSIDFTRQMETASRILQKSDLYKL